MNNHEKIINAIEEKYQEEEKQVLINEFKRLQECDLFGAALVNVGVDNWEGYEQARALYWESKKKEEDINQLFS